MARMSANICTDHSPDMYMISMPANKNLENKGKKNVVIETA
jgi:hypothetical protein